MTAPDLLVSDREREAAADRLRAAAGEGRLTAEELGERVGRVYAARTHGELAEALTGLPPAAVGRPSAVRSRLVALAAWWIPPNLISILVWAVSGGGDFWPKWVLLATTIAILGRGRRLRRPSAPPLPLPPPRLPHDTGRTD